MPVKSYQGETVGKQAPKAEEIHVEHYMNKSVVSFKTTQDILEIMDALVKNGISGGPIVSESNEVVGFIAAPFLRSNYCRGSIPTFLTMLTS